jgi:hypothetical protein
MSDTDPGGPSPADWSLLLVAIVSPVALAAGFVT